jgi:diacylglycerol kinase family enzyme
MLADRDCAVVVGGDGAVRLTVDAIAASGLPLWHLPAGTENLVARAFSMSADPRAIVAAVDAWCLETIDLGVVELEDLSPGLAEAGVRRVRQPFVVMASVGFDAAVVHRLASVRGASISHLSYLPVILSQLTRWVAPEVRISVDGGSEQSLGRGTLIVGNLGEYGFRIDPVRLADGTDGLLDAVFLPATHGVAALAWGARFLLTRNFLNREVVGLSRFRGRSFRVTSSPAHWQADGDPVGEAPAPAASGASAGSQQPPVSVLISVQRAALSILLPVAGPTGGPSDGTEAVPPPEVTPASGR